MKVALVHDYLDQFGGAERVLQVLNEIFPDAPIFTSIFNQKNFPDEFKKMDIRMSFMQRLPFIFKNFRAYVALYPFAFQSFNLEEYDLIISSSSAFAKGIRKRKGAIHVCYCHNPMRFVWRFEDYIKNETLPKIIKSILPVLFYPLKVWDLSNSRSVDYFIANSEVVSKRIKSIYKRDSVIIYPPIETSKFSISEKNGDYFLIVSRLVGYKRINIAVDAFSRLNLKLLIVGDGSAKKDLKKRAGANVKFLGKVSDEEIIKLYSECQALISTAEEDLGMAPLEAAASGRPTIAFGAGGSLETVIDGKTGIFFNKQTVDSLIEAIEKFKASNFNKNEIREHAQRFDKEIFKDKIRSFLYENKIL